MDLVSTSSLLAWLAAAPARSVDRKNQFIKIFGWKGANNTEFDEHAPNPVVIFMPEGSRTHMGNTMRLGSRRTLLRTADCIIAKLYHNPEYVDERHRHRYEV